MVLGRWFFFVESIFSEINEIGLEAGTEMCARSSGPIKNPIWSHRPGGVERHYTLSSAHSARCQPSSSCRYSPIV